ncbi:hypothetical protein K2173_019742 [Erythroxylum novogranatense]|uniref:BHLH domain-containing protein n=1 Tax=Erythroxylum novogranatense TaxID=1862640 RepID=A0AAV8SMD0_9ROSI|nr:hypothetical protein K2173_019742 [Erythroxylum novogranatense]
MSTRRPRTSKFTEDEINDLAFKLQALLAQLGHRNSSRVSASKILKETCNYIRKLHGELDDLSGKLSQILDSMDISGVDIECLRTLIEN